MEVLRRNTDYALRMMVAIAKQFKNEELMSARRLTSDCNFSYELGRKLLQRLHKADLLNSVMGLKGGFTLSRKPSEITLMAIINVLQGGIYLNNSRVTDVQETVALSGFIEGQVLVIRKGRKQYHLIQAV